MVKVFFSLSPERLALAMQGHASYGAHGEDVVCAACSILATTLAQMVVNGAQNGAFYAPPTVHLERGAAFISCAPRADAHAELLHDYYMAQVGFSLLQREYPQCIELSVVEG